MSALEASPPQPAPTVDAALEGPAALAPAIPAGTLALGYHHGCALEDRACVACWGLNDPSGGAAGPPPSRVPAAGPVRSVGVGVAFACLLGDDGHVACFGSDERGQLGDGAHAPQATPIVVPGLDHVTRLALGGEHACALRDDGRVWCWGSGETGQLGDGRKRVGTQGKPSPMLGIDDAIDVAAGEQSTCVVRRDATVACAGRGVARAVAVPGLSDVEELALGTYFGCARLHDETVRCWGQNGEGALGRPQPASTAAALAVPGLGGVARIAAGGATACAITREAGVWCWGHDVGGLLETKDNAICVPSGPNGTACGGGAAYRSEPRRIPWMTGVVDVALTANDGCVRFGTGSVRCWGLNARWRQGVREPAALLPLAAACR